MFAAYPGVGAKLTARAAGSVEADYCNIIKLYNVTGTFSSLVNTIAEIYKTIMVDVIKTPLSAIYDYTNTTGILAVIDTVIVNIFKGALTAADVRFNFSYADNLL